MTYIVPEVVMVSCRPFGESLDGAENKDLPFFFFKQTDPAAEGRVAAALDSYKSGSWAAAGGRASVLENSELGDAAAGDSTISATDLGMGSNDSGPSLPAALLH